MAEPGHRFAYIEVTQKRERYTLVQVIPFELPENEPLTDAHYSLARRRFLNRIGGNNRYPIKFTALDPKLLREKASA